ncbi:hypothetical protein RXV86_10190 [Alisedimentitalea sp. MJ-SS2]|uniref:hypothetical protein n=1 Tax=Aliisedimentitalea sp. MJ-SS2 TaxID=3049795 RepID=UPI0029158504|nr:hypothetical protein [Alisedimentitalea sp. MJ-SS2]MDU8927753.1 hypothetical protein [Alisedimentitalea sp. MJ-SS2]
MHVVADTEQLVTDGVINEAQAEEIRKRGRQAMMALAINSILSFGILAATLGLIFWLGNAAAVAVFGLAMLIGGMAILFAGGEMYRMFGNAAALIGAGMLIGGAAVELLDKYESSAGPVMTLGGAILVVVFTMAFLRARDTAAFVTGTILLMGFAFHLVGLGFWMEQAGQTGLTKALFFLYAAAALAGLGWFVDVRLITAFAIVPFAQALDTGTAYFHAMYVFYSPEPTLSILQMALLMTVTLLIVRHRPERLARHARILAILGFIVANLCALVGSLWGDVVGETMWGPQRAAFTGDGSWDAWRAAREAWRETAIEISEGAFTVFWAVALAGMIAYSAWRGHRGLFNTAITFAAIHAYTQLFESFGDEPLAYVIGGLAAIPLAWGMWRLDHWMTSQTEAG